MLDPSAAQAIRELIARNTEPDPFGGCWLWTKLLREDGYGGLKRSKKYILAHRASYEAHKGPIGGLFVLHKCDVRACVNPDHLFLGTTSDNMQDMVRKGRDRHADSVVRMTPEEVETAVRLRKEGVAIRAIAQQVGKSPTGVALRLKALGVVAPATTEPDPAEVFLQNVEYDTNGGCWLWAKWVADDGYGHACYAQKGTLRAHRVAFEIFKGPIPKWIAVRQTCGIRSCCNPAHLYLARDVRRPLTVEGLAALTAALSTAQET